MPDRLRQMIFDILGARYGTPGAFPALRVADVFAGCGCMGLEALSRGAAQCTFFERDREALRTLQENIEALQIERASIVERDAWTASIPGPGDDPHELIFLDPPYRDSRDSSPDGAVGRYLRRFPAGADRRCLILLHHSADADYGKMHTGGTWRVEDKRRVGSHGLTFFAR